MMKRSSVRGLKTRFAETLHLVTRLIGRKKSTNGSMVLDIRRTKRLNLLRSTLGVTVQTVVGYYRLVSLPETVKEMVDKGVLPQKLASANCPAYL